jgi:hypothetical protein
MQVDSYSKLGLALVATAIMAATSLDALPQHPSQVAWPSLVSWLAFGSATAALFAWFSFIAWLAGRVASYRLLARGALLPLVALVGSAAFAAPLLLAMLVLSACRLALECEGNAQGYFNVLSVFARDVSIGWSLLASIVLVAVTAAVARESK